MKLKSVLVICGLSAGLFLNTSCQKTGNQTANNVPANGAGSHPLIANSETAQTSTESWLS